MRRVFYNGSLYGFVGIDLIYVGLYLEDLESGILFL